MEITWSDVRASERLMTTNLSLDCKLRIRCVWRKVIHRQQQKHKASYPRAFVPMFVVIQASFFVRATNDISWLPTEAPYTKDLHEQAAQFRHFPSEILGSTMAISRSRSARQCTFYVQPNHVWSSLKRQWKPFPRCWCWVACWKLNLEPMMGETEKENNNFSNRKEKNT